jgi:hypothetical protein
LEHLDAAVEQVSHPAQAVKHEKEKQQDRSRRGTSANGKLLFAPPSLSKRGRKSSGKKRGRKGLKSKISQ